MKEKRMTAKQNGNKKAEAWSLLTASAHCSLSSFSSLYYTKLRTYRKEMILSENP